MSRFHPEKVLSTAAAAAACGLTREEFAEYRKQRIAPAADVDIPGQPLGWKPCTISRFKKFLAEMKVNASK